MTSSRSCAFVMLSPSSSRASSNIVSRSLGSLSPASLIFRRESITAPTTSSRTFASRLNSRFLEVGQNSGNGMREVMMPSM